ncbi:MAG: hypothetical protein Q9222_005400 [Ikaeria aurantiellina]
MSYEANHLQRTVSPSLSGRSSPVNSRIKAGEDVSSRTDKPTRRYAAGIDRALSLFDTALQEWADYISFLGRLLKALQLHPPGVSDIPHKALVTQRLSQCLNPALPSGVHQKALEVYTYIFSLIGKDGLGRDLRYYLPGLSPVLAFASLSVKPAILSLFDTFVVALDPVAIRPALKGIILALLPGLEEETSEEFERTHEILQTLKNAVTKSSDHRESMQDTPGDQFFWQCMFLATITSPSRRQGALAYLQRHLPQLGETKKSSARSDSQNGEDRRTLSHNSEAVTSPEPGLLIRCFAAGLYDDQLLVQRGFLDLLASNLPLHSKILQHKVNPADLIKLVAATISVALRREMSLNRRLWAWFLGPDEPVPGSKAKSAAHNANYDGREVREHQTKYFQDHGFKPLVQGIRAMFEIKTGTAVERARPFRICLALMDRSEIGGFVVPEIFLPALRSIWRYEQVASTAEDLEEVLRSAKVFFDGVESGLIFDEISNKLLRTSDTQTHSWTDFQKSLEIAHFIVNNFSMQEEEMLLEHLPLLALSLLLKFKSLVTSSELQGQPSKQAVLPLILSLVGHLLDMIPGRSFDAQNPKPPGSLDQSSLDVDTENRKMLVTIQNYYESHRGHPRSREGLFDRKNVTRMLLLNTLDMIIGRLLSNELGPYFEAQVAILDRLLGKTSAGELIDLSTILSNISKVSESWVTSREGSGRLEDIVLMVSFLESIHTSLSPNAWLDDHRLRSVLTELITGLWPYLSPKRPQSNVDAARYVWKIHMLSNDKKLVESCIAALLVEQSTKLEAKNFHIESARRFTNLWFHSNLGHGSHARRSSLVTTPSRPGSATLISENDRILARPLLLLLDTLQETKTELFTFTSGWLQSQANVESILGFLQSKLNANPCIARSDLDVPSQTADDEDLAVDLDDFLYTLVTINNVIKFAEREIWPSLLSRPVRRNNSNGFRDTESKIQSSSALHDASTTMQDSLAGICLHVLSKEFEMRVKDSSSMSHLQQVAVSLLQAVILRAASVQDIEAKIESSIIKTLSWSVRKHDHPLQVSLMELLSVWLERRLSTSALPRDSDHRKVLSAHGSSRRSISTSDEPDKEKPPMGAVASPPPSLLDCIMEGLRSTGSHPVLLNWMRFLNLCLPLYISDIFQLLLPLVDCFVKTIGSCFKRIQSAFERTKIQDSDAPDPLSTTVDLLNGVEHVLMLAHGRLLESVVDSENSKTAEQAHGLFGSMVSGVFPADAHKTRSTTANNRLTVILCFKDVVKLSLEIWSWGSNGLDRSVAPSGSFRHAALRLKNSARRVLERLGAAESLECLETLIESCTDTQVTGKPLTQLPLVVNLLDVLDGSRPRNTVPAIFNALYSRTNPAVLDSSRRSTLTSELSDNALAYFLIEYTRSLEDDAMDEIWQDCMTFLKDVLANPLPHRQILPKLLEFTALLGIKVDNTNFGENRKRRRDLGDLFLRQLTATFTTKPISFAMDISSSRIAKPSSDSQQAHHTQNESAADDVVMVLAAVFPNISKILVDSDRITTASTIISTHVTVPTFRWKSFPKNVSSTLLGLLLSLSRTSEALRVWRKDITDAFNDPRFFSRNSYGLAASHWLPLIRQWIILDKDRMIDFLSRIPSPTSAGIVFGVGTSSARLEADRKTQLNLRRVAILLLAAADDSFAVNIGAIQEKIADLLNATAASSPSSAIRAEIYMVLRALVLKVTPVHMVSLWPMITAELQEALSSLHPGRVLDKYNMHSIVHVCKLLDTLVLIAPDDFQIREWLFITDTIDAVYRPEGLDPTALVDDLAEELDMNAGVLQSAASNVLSTSQVGGRKPLLTAGALQGIPREKLLDRAIRPFLRQLSINTFESTYSMESFDWQAVYEDLLLDIFDDSHLV